MRSLFISTLWCMTIVLSYEYGRKLGADKEKWNSMLSELKVKRCIETLWK